MLYAVLKTMSWLASHTPYKLLVIIGTGVGHLYWHIAKNPICRYSRPDDFPTIYIDWNTLPCLYKVI